VHFNGKVISTHVYAQNIIMSFQYLLGRAEPKAQAGPGHKWATAAAMKETEAFAQIIQAPSSLTQSCKGNPSLPRWPQTWVASWVAS
jgi:hypothetical protein